MRFFNAAACAAVLALTVTGATAAHASTTLDTSLADPPGVFFGTGNFNTHYAVAQQGDVEIGLKSKIRGDANDSVDPHGTDIYNIALGNKVSFDYAVIDTGDGSALAGATAFLAIHNVAEDITYTFNPALAVLGNATSGSSYENSEQLAFFPVDFSVTQPGVYDITLTLSNLPGGASPLSVRNVVNYGMNSGAVPEPATWAMLLMGFGGLGALLRRQRRAAPLAA